MTKYREVPLDDYTNDPGTTLNEALINTLDRPEARERALHLVVERLAEAGILTNDDVLSILNAGLGWGPTRADYRWEIAP